MTIREFALTIIRTAQTDLFSSNQAFQEDAENFLLSNKFAHWRSFWCSIANIKEDPFLTATRRFLEKSVSNSPRGKYIKALNQCYQQICSIVKETHQAQINQGKQTLEADIAVAKMLDLSPHTINRIRRGTWHPSWLRCIPDDSSSS